MRFFKLRFFFLIYFIIELYISSIRFILFTFYFSKLLTKKICVLGGHLDPKAHISSLQENGGEELKILVLTKAGAIYLWQETYPQTTRCHLSLHRYIDITDMVLNKTSLLLTSSDGEGFYGEIKIKKIKNVLENDKRK